MSLENLFANKFKDDPHCKVSRSDLDRILQEADLYATKKEAQSSSQIIQTVNIDATNYRNFSDINKKREELISTLIVQDAKYYPLQTEMKTLESQYTNLRYFVYADTNIGKCAYKEIKTIKIKIEGDFSDTEYLKRVSKCPPKQTVEKGDYKSFQFFLGDFKLVKLKQRQWR